MRQIELRQLPNQSLSITLSGNVYDITIRAVKTGDAQVMAVDVSINDVFIVRGCRAVAGYPIIPSLYLENGNFVIVTDNGDLPDYNLFQISQFLIYASPEELAMIDSGDFNG